MASSGNLLTIIDAGSAKTAVLICEAADSVLRYRGHATVESRGSRKGVIVELDKAVQEIDQDIKDNQGYPTG